MRLTFIVLLFIPALILAGFTEKTQAQCVTDQSQLIYNSGRSARNLPGYYEGQSFTAGITGQLAEISLQMFVNMSGTGTLKIYAGSGIGGTLLTTQPVSVNVPSGYVWQNWTLTNPPQVNAGSIYTFQFIPTQGGGLPDPYGICAASGNPYPGGQDIIMGVNFDLTFKTCVIPQTLFAWITAGSATTFCQGGNVVLTAQQQGNPYTYQWLKNDSPINGATAAQFTAAGTGNYSVILDSLGVKDTSNIISVTVNPLPTVTIVGLPGYINYAAPVVALSGSPAGGSFSGSGVSGSSFSPTLAGLGISHITYNYTDINGCSNSASASTLVYDTTGIVCTSYDTVTTYITHYDTLFISVTDTLIIHALLTGLTPPGNINTLKVYPNPASSHLFIDNGNYTAMTGYTISIVNSAGQSVFFSPVNQPLFLINLSQWTGAGLYYLYLNDDSGTCIDTRKIILQ